MSKIEARYGKLIPINYSGTIEEAAEEICTISGYKLYDTYNGWLDCLDQEGYRTYFIKDEAIYLISDVEYDPENLVESKKNEDGSISYRISFHNGDCSLDEILEKAVDNASKSYFE